MQKFILALALLFSVTAFAQNHFIGIQGGVNRTNISESLFTEDADSRSGFNVGLSYQYRLNKKFHFGADLLYNQKGFTKEFAVRNESGNPAGDNITVQYDYDYVSLPLKAGITVGRRFSGFANIGLVPSILVDAKHITPAVGQIPAETDNVTDIMTRFELSGLVELGASYALNRDILISASVGYQGGLSSLSNDNYFANEDVYHRAILTTIGLRYALTRG